MQQLLLCSLEIEKTHTIECNLRIDLLLDYILLLLLDYVLYNN